MQIKSLYHPRRLSNPYHQIGVPQRSMLQTSEKDSFTPRFASGSDITTSSTATPDAPDATTNKPSPSKLSFNQNASMALGNLLTTLHIQPFEDNYTLPLLMALCNQPEVTAYLEKLDFQPYDIFKGLRKVYDAKKQVLGTSSAEAPQIGKLVEPIQLFAAEEGLERITTITLWRWIMVTDPTRNLEKTLSQAGLKSDMIERLRKAPNTEKITNTTDSADRPTREDVLAIRNALQTLPDRVIGQNKAVTKLLNSYRRSKLGYDTEKDKPNRPKVREILLGPSGVGKTFSIEVLAKALGRELIYIPLNEFGDESSVNRLTGAAPGYKGYGDGTALSDRIIKAREAHVTKGKPLPIVLFDEIEKAHPKVFDVLMQVLDKGELTTGTNEVASFKGIDVLMTSNIGQKQIAAAEARGISDEDLDKLVKAEMEKVFRPEFIGRVAEPIIYRSLSREDASKILDININSLKKEVMKADQIELTVEAPLKDEILRKGYSSDFGVRRLKDVMDVLLHSPMVKKREDLILSGELDKNRVIPAKASYQAEQRETVLEYQLN